MSWTACRPHLCALLLCLASLAAGCGRPAPAVVPPAPPEVFFVLPAEEDFTEYEEFTGRVWSPNTVELRSRVSGYLQEILFKDGSSVEVGQPLFVIDPRSYEVEVKRSKAAVDQADAKLKRMNNQVARADKLVSTNAVSAQEYDQVRFDRDEAKGALEAAQASLAMAELDLSYTRVTSPLKGKISRRLVDPGNLVESDKTALANLVSLDPVYIYFDVDERTLLKLRRLIMEGEIPEKWENQVEVQISLTDEQDFGRRGLIDFVDTQVDPQTGTLRMRANVKNEDFYLSPGMFARCRLPIGKAKPGLFVKEEALGSDQGQLYLFVLNDADEVEYRRVEPGPLINGRRVIRSNLKATERVVVSGLQRVKPGSKVTPKPEPTSPAQTASVGGPTVK